MKDAQEIVDYIFDNEEWDNRYIICPYCKSKQEDIDPSVMYNVQEDYELDYESCGRTFILNSEICFNYTTTPITSEIIEILRGKNDNS